jgi:hypothetical protein
MAEGVAKQLMVVCQQNTNGRIRRWRGLERVHRGQNTHFNAKSGHSPHGVVIVCYHF